MAIWPFGRKSKRHTIQVSPDEADALQTSLEQETPVEPTLGRKPSRRPSKRQNKGTSRSGDGSDSVRASTRTSSHRPLSLDHRMPEQQNRPEQNNMPQRRLSHTASLLNNQPPNGPNKLRKSKRRTDEILRERQIRMLSSTPIDIPRRTTAPDGDYVLEHRKRRANGRRADRYMSDVSLSVRNSAASSISDISDPFTYKVKAFAALTPRPVVRYVEAPRLPTARSHEPSVKEPGRRDKGRLRELTMSEENLYYSRRRVNELADALDAGGLRELLDRDRRRREKQQLDDQERLRRKLQERADEQAAEEKRQAIEETTAPQPEPEAVADTQNDTEQKEEHIQIQIEEPTPEEPTPGPAEESETWLRGQSQGSDAARRESLDSANVVGNIDDSSVREMPKLSTRPGFAPSHEMGMSRTTLSPSHSSLRQGISSPSQSQTFGIGSASDLSDRRSSDTSGRRGNTITSLFRRGSSRLKRRYRERFQDSAPEVSQSSQPSSESFYKIQTQSSPPRPSLIPSRSFMPTGTVMRSHSKFTEHFDFGDEPLSPPDSRLQSPDIPEQVPESSLENEENSTFLNGSTPGAGMDIVNPRRRRHQSWNDSIDAESDNVPLSQSLASIDSEGSWMSGDFFRRMSHKPGSPVRANMTSFEAAMDGAADTHDHSRDSVDSHGASSHVMGEPELDDELGGTDAGKPSEMWHRSEVGRRPIVVNPATRPKSTQGMLRSIPSLSPISAEEDYISDEETDSSPVPQRVASQHGEIGHVELEQD